MVPRNIQHLPSELLIHCCSYLNSSTRDIQNLRLTSKALNHASSPFLLDNLTVKINPESISVLEAVSTHPIFSKSIEKIRLCLCFYNNVPDQQIRADLVAECNRCVFSHFNAITRIFNSVERSADDEQQFEMIKERGHSMLQALSYAEMGINLDSAPQTIQIITNALDVYQRRYDDQQRVLKDGTHLLRIGQALSKLCRPLTFELYGYDITSKNEFFPQNSSLALIKERFTSDQVFLEVMLHSMTTRGQNLTVEVETNFFDTFKGIFNQLSKYQIFPARFNVDFNVPKHIELFRPTEFERNTIRSILQKTDHLSFSLYWWSKPEPNFDAYISTERFTEMEHLASFTRTFFDTENLQSFALNLHDYSPHIDPPYISLYDLLPDCRWPRLQFLTLCAVPFHQREIRRLVALHKNSLKVLEMHSLSLLSGSWKNSFEALRGLGKLEAVSCVWPMGGEFGNGDNEDDLVHTFDEKSTCEYILGVKGAENPLV
ncbi:hypothetical protein FQN50_007706 [Emmonsiellopsis sp. PD_5]|nr:hypothetical protein FQN50_007706 [Emmonsiellopsis sp. PD_5]